MLLRNIKLKSEATYYVRFSDHINEDLKRGWSSWNFGEEGFEGTEEELQEALSNITDNSPFWISGFDIYPDSINEYEIKELYPNYWVVVDNINAHNGLSAHELPSSIETLEDVLKEVTAKKYKYDGTGEGDSFESDKATVIYSKDDMHIIEVIY